MCILSRKASKEAITPHVETLLALKNEYKSITGKDFGAPATAASASASATAKKETKKEDKKEKKPKEESKPGPSKSTTTTTTTKPTAKLTTTPSAPTSKATSTSTPAATVPTLAEVVSGDGKSVDWVALDARLKVYSYVAGYAPTKDDNRYTCTPLIH